MLKKIILYLTVAIMLTGCTVANTPHDDKTFNIIVSSENKDLEGTIRKFAKEKHLELNIDYYGTLDIMNVLNKNPEKYDAVWSSNSIWLYMLDNPGQILYSKFTSINPIVFGMTTEKAHELGFDDSDKKVYTQDIVDAVKQEKLTFLMPSATQTNSGASAYLGFLSCLAGNPFVLTEKDLENEDVKAELNQLFKGVARSSGSDEFIGEMFLNGDFDALVDYEASIINLNKELIENGKKPLYLVYPYDGVSLSDSPFAYINNGNDKKLETFKLFQNYLLSEEVQQYLTDTGRRAGYGGLVPYADSDTFNPEWGINTAKYISPIKYPSPTVIKKALNLYQDELRKPSYTIFCLDYSGSMDPDGHRQLVAAMEQILNYETAALDMIQFSERDKIVIIPFSSDVIDIYETQNGIETEGMLQFIRSLKPGGGTNIYDPSIAALEILDNIDPMEYSRSVVLMTDGASNNGYFKDLKNAYEKTNKSIPIFSITFGSASEDQLKLIAELTNAKVMNGTQNLIEAFKSVRGYN